MRDQAPPELIDRACRGDREAFGLLYDHYLPRIYAFCRKYAPREDAEDLTTQTFEKALGAIHLYRDHGAPFSAWLLRIAANTVVDWARKGSDARLGDDEIERLGDEGFLQIWEQAYWLRDHIESLPADQREAIHRRFFEDKPFRQVANDMGRSEGAVKQLLRRALARLARRLQDEADADE